MKKFIKDNLFKIIIILCLVGVAISIGYYYVIFLPIEKREKQVADQKKEEFLKRDDLFSKKENCQKYKKQIEDEIDKSNNSGANSYTVLEGIYYSPIKNTCIYVSTEYIPRNIMSSIMYPKFITKRVIDVLSGETIKAVFIDVEKDFKDNSRMQKEVDFESYVWRLTEM